MKRAYIKLKKGEGRTLKTGGMWIFDNEIDKFEGTFNNGDVIDILDFNDYNLGCGFINTHSKIRVRALSRVANQIIDRNFFKMRVESAWEYRKKVVDTSSCRVIFGEADFLPGLVIDKFSDILVVQCMALGMEQYKHTIVELLKEVLTRDGFSIRGVYERSDGKVRVQEGLERIKGFLGHPFDTKVEIIENNVKYFVDVADGQKTGFFLDQKYNRQAIGKICGDMKVLDCFTHTGSFALNAGINGAKSVIGVDASDLAVAQATQNAKLNGLEDKVTFICADVFELLPEYESKGEMFDVIILDPPAFTKSRASIKNATKGYREINLRALKMVKDNGYFATCSCSHFLSPELFTDTIAQAAKMARKRLRQIEFRTQSPDHPILWAANESYYLKFYIFQVTTDK